MTGKGHDQYGTHDERVVDKNGKSLEGGHRPARFDDKQRLPQAETNLPDKSSGAGQQHAGNARPDQQGQGRSLKR